MSTLLQLVAVAVNQVLVAEGLAWGSIVVRKAGEAWGHTLMTTVCVSLAMLVSVAVRVRVKVPVSVGLPLRVRVEAVKEMPAGSVPVRA